MIEICKLLFNLCFYYTLSGYFMYIITGDYPSVWGVPILILSAGIYIAVKKKREGSPSVVLTAFCCALPSVLFVFDLTIWQMLQYVPVWAFLGYTVWKNRIYTDREDFKRHFRFTGTLFLTAIIGFFINDRVWDAITFATPYLIIYLLTGVCIMRLLREEGQFSGKRNVAALLILLLASGVLAILQMPQIFLGAVGFIYQNIIANLIVGLAFAIGAIVIGVIRVFAWLSGYEYEVPPYSEGDDQAFFGEDGMNFTGVTPAWLEVAAVVLLVLVVAVFAFLIMRMLLGKKHEKQVALPYTEEQERLHRNERSRIGGILRPRDPRLAVRWYYRKYLKEGVSRGALPDAADTSLSVLKKYEPYFPGEEAGALRDLYIEARYRYGKEITKEDTDTASKIWRRLLNSQKRENSESF